MKRKIIILIILTVLIAGTTSIGINVFYVKASSTIVIKADGSIEGTANITSTDNITYTFIGNNYDEIRIQRSNIIIDGDGYSLIGNGGDLGFFCRNLNNITIKNLNIDNFSYGIAFENSSFCTISENNITNSEHYGISLSASSNNTIVRNNLTSNTYGVSLGFSHNNVSSNTFINNGLEVFPDSSCENIVSNNLVNGKPLVYLEDASDLTVGDAGQVVLIKCNRIRVENLNLSNASIGVQLILTNNTEIFGNNISNNVWGIKVSLSNKTKIMGNNLINNIFGIETARASHNIICKNNISKSLFEGIHLSSSFNNSISSNNITLNAWGISIWFANHNNSISGNNLSNNSVSIDSFNSSNNIFFGNNIVHSQTYGIRFTMSSNNYIYHNNFVDNTQEVILYLDNHDNKWNNSYPYGGNYWSKYDGTDLNHDGIGDFPYAFDVNNTDNHPLMGMFNSFNTSLGKHVNVISNSTINDFEYCQVCNYIRINVTNSELDQTHGFCRVSIPYEVMSEPFNVTINGAEPIYYNYTLYDNGSHRWIYFEYEHSIKDIIIIPEVPALAILPFLMISTLLTALLLKKKNQV